MAEKNNQYSTKKDLEKTLEKALESQSKTILKAVDFSFGKIKEEVVGIKYDIKEVKKDVAELKFNDRKFAAQQDKISKQLTDLQQESKMSLKLYQRHDKTIENHGERISKLELKIEPIL